ncbi:putative kinesin heavy chain [Cryptosporidium canis]|uniref:Kinesin heavy chain n=1 Tax=Cryptosporidium canis TaxID=195482 RepID=A0ABQ8P7W0_9CRYT|nr:putative kinesin heavy chain [Cryptosporidium canis]
MKSKRKTKNAFHNSTNNTENTITQASKEIDKIFGTIIKRKSPLNSEKKRQRKESIKKRKLRDAENGLVVKKYSNAKPVRHLDDGLPVYRLEDIDLAEVVRLIVHSTVLAVSNTLSRCGLYDPHILLERNELRSVKTTIYSMENQNIHLNSSFNTKNQHGSSKGELSLFNKVPNRIDINSNKINHVSSGIDKIQNSNRIHLNKENVRVIVRVRPIQGDNESSSSCIKIIEDKAEKKQIVLEDPRHRGLPKKYEFDDVYDAESSTEDIYLKEIKEYVDPLLSECSCINIFAFGSSGTGKTFTMHGNFNNEIGVVGLTIKQLIEINDQQIEPGKFSFSFFEVYCEKIRDLLSDVGNMGTFNKQKKTTKSDVSIRTDICGRIKVVGVNNIEFKTWDEFSGIYISALKRRTSGRTAVNSNSSRSHACIQINYIPATSNISHTSEIGDEDTIENRRRRGSISFHVKPKINLNYPRTIVNLIDLSGFENNKITNNTGKRMAESTFINSSLLSLSKVINALKKNAGTQSTQSCIPYRESKLTRLLQEYLGGGGGPPYSPYCLRCIMICTVSPSITHFQQTYATLNTPSYGNNSLRKYVGITSTVVGVGSKKNSTEINNVVLKTPNSINHQLNKTLCSKNLGLKFGTLSLTAGGGKVVKAVDSELLRHRNSYESVESRVAQMIKGKIPLKAGGQKKTKFIDPFHSHKNLPINITGCINKTKQRTITGGGEIISSTVKNTSAISDHALNRYSPKNEGENGNYAKDNIGCSFHEGNRVRPEIKASIDNSSYNSGHQHSDSQQENKPVQMDFNSDYINEKESRQNEQEFHITGNPIEVRKANRPITRSQTKKVS